MTISHVGSVQNAGSGALPTGWQAGDLILVFERNASSTATMSLQAGYTRLAANNDGTNSAQIRYKIAAASDSTVLSDGQFVVSVYRASGGTIGVGASALSFNTGTTITIPGLTLLGASSWVWVGAHGFSFGQSSTPPSGITSRANGSNAPAAGDTNGIVGSFAAKSWAQAAPVSGQCTGASVEITETTGGGGTGPTNYPKSLTVSSSGAVSAKRSSAKRASITSASSVLATAGLAYLKALAVSCASAVSVATPASFVRTLSATSSSVVSSAKQAARNLAVGSSGAIALKRAASRALAVASSSTLTLATTKAFLRSLSVASASAVSVASGRAFLRALSVTSASAVTRASTTGKGLSAAVSSTVANRSGIAKKLALTASGAVTAARSIAKGLSAAGSSLASVVANFVAGGTGGTATTWNPADKASNLALSNGNLTVTGDGTLNTNVRATTSKTSGKWYFENLFGGTLSSDNTAFGIAKATASLTSWLGGDANSVAIYQEPGGAFLYYNAAGQQPSSFHFDSGNTVACAFDLDLGLIWFRIWNGTAWGAWNGSLNGDPAAGTGGFAFTVGGAAWFPAASPNGNGETQTANFGATAFLGTVPSGFSAVGPASSGTTYTQSLAIACAGTVAASRGAAKSLAVNASLAVAVLRQSARKLSVAGSSSVASLRGVSRKLAAASASTVSAATGRAFTRALSIASASTVSVIRGSGYFRSVAVSCASSVSSLRGIGKGLAIASTSAASLTRTIGKALAVASSGAIALRRSVTHGLAVIASGAVSAAKGITRKLALSSLSTVAVSSAATVVQFISLTVSAASLVSLGRAVTRTKALLVSVGSATSLARNVGRGLAVTASSAIALRRAIAKGVLATGLGMIALGRAITRGLSISAQGSVRAGKGVARSLAVSVSSLVGWLTRFIPKGAGRSSKPVKLIGRASRAELTGKGDSVSLTGRANRPKIGR